MLASERVSVERSIEQQVFQAIFSRRYLRPRGEQLEFEKLFREGSHALVTTNSFNSVVTDSAAAATAMACGLKTRNEMIGVDPEGKACRTILDIARASGRATGLVGTMRPSHATPASFVATHVSRLAEVELTEQIVREAKVDLILGGGGRWFLPKTVRFSERPECKGLDASLDGKGKRKDNRDLISESIKKGYRFACTRKGLENAVAEAIAGSKDGRANGRLLGLFAGSNFPHIQERRKIKNLPGLADMTSGALKFLSAKSPRGFFLMIESGLIDYAGHANDAGTMLQETLDMDKTIGVVREFMRANPGTLLIVTADHETGGFGLAYRRPDAPPASETLPGGTRYKAQYLNPGRKVFRDYLNQKASFGAMISPILKKLYPKKDDYTPNPNYSLERAARDLSRTVRLRTPYRLSVAQAKRVLEFKKMPARRDMIQYPAMFTTITEFGYFANKLGRVLADRNFAAFASGNHSHAPVHAFFLVSGGKAGNPGSLIENTDIFRVMKKALEGEP